MQRSCLSPRRPEGFARRAEGFARRAICATVVFAVLLALLPARSALAQGTDGALPDPISARQLTGYADRLGLSPQQRLAVEPMHETYRESFRVLREGEIKQFMDEASSMQPGMLPEREKMVAIFDRMKSIQDRIERLDNGFFDSLQPILTPEQAALLPRIKEKRERERATGPQIEAQMQMAGCPSIDLSDMVPDLDLDPSVLETVDPALASYEHQLTSKLQKLNESVYGMYIEMFDRVAEAGHADFDFTDPNNDPELTRKVMELWQTVITDLMAKTREIASGIGELNERTYRSIRANLPERPARAFRNLYVSRSYPETTSLLPIEDQRWIDRALELQSLSPEEREGLQTAAADHYRQLDGIVDEAVKVLDEGRGTFSPFQFDQEAWTARQEKITALNARAAKVREDTLALMTALLGQDVLDRVRAEATQARTDGGTAGAIAGAIENGAIKAEGAATEETPDEIEQAQNWSDRFIPKRISRRDVVRYRERLAAGDDLEAVIDELYTKYREDWDTLEPLRALREANTKLWEQGEGATSPAEDKIARLDSLRREALAAVYAADDGFFEDLRAVLSEEKGPALDRLALNRRRATYLAVENQGMFGGASETREDTVDLAVLSFAELDLAFAELDGAAGSSVPEEAMAKVDGILVEYETASLPLLKNRLEAMLESQRGFERFTAMQRDSADDTAAQLEFGRRYEELVGAAAKRSREASTALASLNHSTIDRLASALGASDGQRLRLAYNREAFPTVYLDEAFVGVQLTKAIEAPDLRGEQRTQLGELAATYRPEYERLSRGMIDLTVQGGMTSWNWQEDGWADEFRKVQDRQQQLERLRFERDELNFRTITRLRALLSEEEIARLGGLPEPKEKRENRFFP